MNLNININTDTRSLTSPRNIVQHLYNVYLCFFDCLSLRLFKSTYSIRFDSIRLGVSQVSNIYCSLAVQYIYRPSWTWLDLTRLKRVCYAMLHVARVLDGVKSTQLLAFLPGMRIISIYFNSVYPGRLITFIIHFILHSIEFLINRFEDCSPSIWFDLILLDWILFDSIHRWKTSEDETRDRNPHRLGLELGLGLGFERDGKGKDVTRPGMWFRFDSILLDSVPCLKQCMG